MRHFFNLSALLFVLQISCYSQKSGHANGEQVFAPCFHVEQPKVIQLPDSLKLKGGVFISFQLTCFYDSLGAILKLVPQVLFIQNGTSTIGKYFFWKNWQDRSVNVKQIDANTYADWAKAELPRIIRIVRYPSNIRCTQKIAKQNSLLLECRMQ